jgi:enoyl-CoA hydratase/carnithine racemase
MLFRRILSLNSSSKTFLYRHASSTSSLINISTSHNDQICRIKLNNPRQRNILSLAMINDLIKALEDNEYRSRVIVLTAGDQTVFSSGHSLKELAELSKTKACNSVFDRCTELMLKVRQLSIPVIAEVFGLAAAAGCQLVASCDIVVAGENASFSVPGVKHGLFCITPAVALRRSITNPKLSSLMLFTGEPISAKEAYQHGLVSRVVGENDLERETDKIAQQICEHSRSVVAIGKKYLQMKDEKDDLRDDYQVATRGMIENLELKDTQHGLESFIKKTRPTWSHKDDKI